MARDLAVQLNGGIRFDHQELTPGTMVSPRLGLRLRHDNSVTLLDLGMQYIAVMPRRQTVGVSGTCSTR